MSEQKMVPVEPTEEMLDAGANCPQMAIVNGIISTQSLRTGADYGLGKTKRTSALAECYRAMLDAAPQPDNAAAIIQAAIELVPHLKEGWDESDEPEDQAVGNAACDKLIAAVEAMNAAADQHKQGITALPSNEGCAASVAPAAVPYYPPAQTCSAIISTGDGGFIMTDDKAAAPGTPSRLPLSRAQVIVWCDFALTRNCWDVAIDHKRINQLRDQALIAVEQEQRIGTLECENAELKARMKP